MKLKDIPAPTLITAGAVVAWLGTFVLRAVNPDFSGGPAADALMATVTAWWMKTRKDANGGKDDLITEVVGKNVLPYISTAHAEDTPAPQQAPPQQAAPRPPSYQPPVTGVPPRPYTPPPASPKQGGMPWG